MRITHALLLAVSARLTGALDVSDLFRAEVVMTLSALDHYVHEAARAGMLDVFRGGRPSTAAYLNFPVSMRNSVISMNGASAEARLEQEIRNRHSFLSFQHPDKIADAVRLYSNVELWNAVGPAMGATATDVKKRLALLVDRRNKIAHEADRDPTYDGARWPIDDALVTATIDFISALAEAIDVAAGI